MVSRRSLVQRDGLILGAVQLLAWRRWDAMFFMPGSIEDAETKHAYKGRGACLPFPEAKKAWEEFWFKIKELSNVTVLIRNEVYRSLADGSNVMPDSCLQEEPEMFGARGQVVEGTPGPQPTDLDVPHAGWPVDSDEVSGISSLSTGQWDAVRRQELLAQGMTPAQVDALIVRQHRQEMMAEVCRHWLLMFGISSFVLGMLTVVMLVWLCFVWAKAYVKGFHSCDSLLTLWAFVLYSMMILNFAKSTACGHRVMRALLRVKLFNLMLPLFMFTWNAIGIHWARTIALDGSCLWSFEILTCYLTNSLIESEFSVLPSRSPRALRGTLRGALRAPSAAPSAALPRPSAPSAAPSAAPSSAVFPPPRPPRPPSSAVHGVIDAILAFATVNIALTVFMFLNIVGLAYFFRMLLRMGVVQSSKAAPEGSLEASTEKVTAEAAKLADSPQCPICLEDLKPDESFMCFRTLKCNHYFHKACLKDWLQVNRDCPLCRQDLAKPSLEARWPLDGPGLGFRV
ncbi:gol [Symbiodinium natans]|uniref:Gol protein n=1 Tax=Symbiodinium natans TaxID=878477 RepID=A0A812N7H5_9DINO|nr:gol [Symbiodinium natans]